ncbi:MAG: DEAD/DEAH box helicase family protein [Microbacterium sp.]|uniref:DEAD/DEAH box helicase family protein n=1 Tax=Microbacterium sp. TaxID=51671 RepID=UPI001ACC3E77|nr:DEAD/DEAH box helicase family protein [Microbacterium sp.]MBN9214171.1 DEAD/DEAH box helicase family protein [Microbacterium sp.]
MKLTLHAYQEKAADAVVSGIVKGLAEDEDHTAITLAAPTGAGKTIIAAAALERLYEQAPGLTVLWVSTDKELNEQSAGKFRSASAVLAPRLTVLDNAFTAPELDRGRISFINVAKLGRGSNMTKVGESRQHTIWDALNKSASTNSQFVVFVDEAHLGTGSGAAGDDTLLSQLMNGTGLMKRKPRVLVGISATAARFEDRIRGTREITRTVPFDRADLTASGLVKDRLLLTHPDEEIAADMTMIGLAAAKRREYETLWEAYTAQNEEPHVTPAMLLQVPAKPAAATVAEMIATVLAHDETLTADNIFHTFESHTIETFGLHTVRYGAPSDLQRITEAKVILAKDAVTTGWDAPRVEVLVSLRGTSDETVITQLIGRAVRQPLAKRVADDRLNAVNIYLPNFRADSVEKVIGRLTDGDDAVTTEVVVAPVPVAPNPAVPEAVWMALRALPSWTRPQKTARSDVERASKVAHILSAAGVLPEAASQLQTTVVSALRAHLAAKRPFVDEKVAEFEEVNYVTREATWATGDTAGGTVAVLEGATATLTRNVLDLYKKGIARLPGASGAQLWAALCDTTDPDHDPEHERLVVAALSLDPDTATIANAAAAALLSGWVKAHGNDLSPAERADLYAKLEESTRPQQVTVQPPVATQVKPAATSWTHHLLAGDDGSFPDPKSNSWETRILDIELADGAPAVAWYRNPTGGRHALAIPYDGGTLYPDFLIFRVVDGQVRIDIIDPHRPDLDDTIAKWVALAKYAAQANAELGDLARVDRVLAVIEDRGGQLLSLDLTTEQAATSLAAASGEDGIRAVFDQYGGRHKAPAA